MRLRDKLSCQLAIRQLIPRAIRFFKKKQHAMKIQIAVACVLGDPTAAPQTAWRGMLVRKPGEEYSYPVYRYKPAKLKNLLQVSFQKKRR